MSRGLRLSIAAGALLSTAASLAVLTGCGDDDVATPADAGRDAATADAPPAPPLLDASKPSAVTCGTATCAPADYQGIAVLPACCTAQATCGLDLRPAAKFVSVSEKCTPLATPGVADDTCKTYVLESDGGPTKRFDGCCRADKTCGVFVTLSPALDLGCAHADGFVDDAGAPGACGSDGGS